MYDSSEEAEMDGHYDVCPIMMAYNDEETEQLYFLGVQLPEIPLNL